MVKSASEKASRKADGFLDRIVSESKASGAKVAPIEYKLYYISDPHTMERTGKTLSYYGSPEDTGTPEEKQQKAFRRFIKKAVASNSHDLKDLSYLDLSMQDLSDIDISGLNISYSNVSGTLFIGGRGENVNMTGVVGKKIDGMVTDFTKFESEGGIHAPSSHWEEAKLEHLRIVGFFGRGAKFLKCEGAHSIWINPVFTHTVQSRNDWSHSTQVNADRGNSINLRNDFTSADLRDDLKEKSRQSLPADAPFLKGESFPDKYRDATFIGNTFDGVDLTDNEMLKGAVRRDKIIRGVSKAAALAIPIMVGVGVDYAFGAAESQYVEGALDKLKSATGGGLLLSASWMVVANLLPGKIADPITKFIEEKLQALIVRAAQNPIWRPKQMVRKFKEVEWKKTVELAVNDLTSRSRVARGLLNMPGAKRFMEMIGFDPVCLTGEIQDLTPVLRALRVTGKEQRQNPLFQTLKYVLSNKTRVVVCDRAHLAAAMSHISVNKNRGYPLSRDITLVRAKVEDRLGDYDDASLEGTPSTITFKKNGTTMMTWDRGGQPDYAAFYDKDGLPVSQIDLTGDPVKDIPLSDETRKNTGDLPSRVDLFHEAILGDNDLDQIAISDDAMATYGKDGSIVIRHKKTGELHNTLGPAIILYVPDEENKSRLRDDGTRDPWPLQIHFVDGKFMTNDEFDRKFFPDEPADRSVDMDDPSLYRHANISPAQIMSTVVRQFSDASVAAAASNAQGWKDLGHLMMRPLRMPTGLGEDLADDSASPSGPKR